MISLTEKEKDYISKREKTPKYFDNFLRGENVSKYMFSNIVEYLRSPKGKINYVLMEYAC